ncbi:MAG: RluA family pseudouridine synthase [Clostridia bacterium]
MVKMKKVIVENEEKNQRIDAYLAKKYEDMSRVAVKRLIDEEKILVNNKKTKASYKVQENDEITIEEEIPKEIELKAQNIPLEILYEDNDIIVVNKPKGMVVHPANGNPDGTLVNAVMAICHDSLSGIGGEIRPGIVHRLDKDTSGVIVVAKNDKAHINLSEQIKNHEVEKTYLALVKGFVKENEATINMPIGRSTSNRKKMAVTKSGKQAITHFKVIKRYKTHKQDYALLEVKIETGRTHQIRVHLSQIGYPIVGDSTYSNGKNEWGIEGQCLHAKSLKFKHPITGKEMYIEAKLPQYYEELLRELEIYGRN